MNSFYFILCCMELRREDVEIVLRMYYYKETVVNGEARARLPAHVSRHSEHPHRVPP